mmetsp:Transcript_10418/g.63641  ORF Transcript_10418/g.63641 Transcript_10418/m.63641 type:complete len:217 (+) Transcript_10418:772-1422(+)
MPKLCHAKSIFSSILCTQAAHLEGTSWQIHRRNGISNCILSLASTVPSQSCCYILHGVREHAKIALFTSCSQCWVGFSSVANRINCIFIDMDRPDPTKFMPVSGFVEAMAFYGRCLLMKCSPRIFLWLSILTGQTRLMCVILPLSLIVNSSVNPKPRPVQENSECSHTLGMNHGRWHAYLMRRVTSTGWLISADDLGEKISPEGSTTRAPLLESCM